MKFDESDIRTLRIWADDSVQFRGEKGLPVSRRMRELRGRLTLAASTMFGPEHQFGRDPSQLNQHEDELLPAREAATIMKCTPQHARRLARRGDIDADFPGGRWLFKRSVVEAYADERRTR